MQRNTASPALQSTEFQIPPDLVVKLKALILLRLFYHHSETLRWFKRPVETGHDGVNGFHHPRSIGPPLNPMECALNHLQGEAR
jgi:hypothetical protein